MGELKERSKLSLLVNGNGIVDNFKNNSLYFYEKYTNKSSEDVLSISVKDLVPGGFYFLHYQNDSNWMKYSPVFVADYKKFSNKIVIFAVNFNFVPLEIRILLFDKFIIDQNFERDDLLKVDLDGMYTELRKIGFEYALMEYDASKILIAHKIKLDILPRFLYHQHPINKYDPNKLIQIWEAKIEARDQRHKEMMLALVSEFYDASFDISEKYDALKGHIQRIRRNN